jgi:hypothetical protein
VEGRVRLSSLERIRPLFALHRRVREFHAYALSLVRQGCEPKTRFVVFAQGRSGSELLRNLLNSHPEVHCDGEILDHKACFPATVVRGRSVRVKAQVYGFKLKILHLVRDQGMSDPEHFVQSLYDGGWKIIHLERHNLLRQTLSGMIAKQRGVYHHRRTAAPDTIQKAWIDCDRLVRNMGRRERHLKRERSILQKMAHLTLVYEDDLLDTSCHQDALDRVFEYLGVSAVPVRTEQVRITTDRLSGFVQNHQEVVEAVGKTEHARYLEG